ncbi:23402_t:CDS:2 [Cetraspora pellucida]|uniref:23402_t:CDS:1 n=1 Tax=Cetraspora pellucida TaxID=1433469 RepID=A0A9N9E4S5_9GLOM|nr:23402_t:CDS:2 [Cetraspora pellucida]
MSDFNLLAFLTLNSTFPISNPMSLEVLDPVFSEISDSVSSILDFPKENLHESYLENDLIDNVIKNNSKKRSSPIHDYLEVIMALSKELKEPNWF